MVMVLVMVVVMVMAMVFKCEIYKENKNYGGTLFIEKLKQKEEAVYTWFDAKYFGW